MTSENEPSPEDTKGAVNEEEFNYVEISTHQWVLVRSRTPILTIPPIAIPATSHNPPCGGDFGSSGVGSSCVTFRVEITPGATVVAVKYYALILNGRWAEVRADEELGWARFEPYFEDRSRVPWLVMARFKNWSHVHHRQAYMQVEWNPP